MTKSNRGLIIGGVTFTLFMAEAIIHYNIGQESVEHDDKIIIPPKNDFIKLAIGVAIFSTLNGIILSQIKH